MEFSRQEYGGGLLFPSPWVLLDPEIEPVSSVSHCIGNTEPLGKPPEESNLLMVENLQNIEENEGAVPHYRDILLCLFE